MSTPETGLFQSPSPDLPPFAVAYQPIVNVPSRRVAAYEALVRGVNGISYPQLTANMDAETLRSFHRHAAEESIRCAISLGFSHRNAALTLNLQPDLDPGALNAEFLRSVAVRYGLPMHRIVVELTEEHNLNLMQLREILDRNKSVGFATAIDDFGAGYSGLTSLATCRPEVLKLDRALISDINADDVKQKIVGAFVRVCISLKMVLIAEGVETLDECRTLRRLGIKFMQGYFFSRPVIAALPRFEECVITQSLASLGRRRNLEESGLRVYNWSEFAAITHQAGNA